MLLLATLLLVTYLSLVYDLCQNKTIFNYLFFFYYQSKDGQTLLLVAAEAGLDNIVEGLLIAGADPNGVHMVQYSVIVIKIILKVMCVLVTHLIK